MASSQNFFVWFCGVLICQPGLIPHRTKSCRVSDPAGQDPAGYQPRRTKSCGVSDPAEQWQGCVHFIAYTCFAGSDTPQNNVLRVLIPRLTKSSGVSDPAEQSPAGYQTLQNNIQKRIFLRIKKRIKKYFRV
jgi:hypothetical protein